MCLRKKEMQDTVLTRGRENLKELRKIERSHCISKYRQTS